MYQCLFKNGNLLKKHKLRKRKPLGISRTSIKTSSNSFSAQSLSRYGSQSLTKSLKKSSQRPSALLNKMKELANKMSGKKTHIRDKSRNLESTLKKNKTSKRELESIPEFNYELKHNYYFHKN